VLILVRTLSKLAPGLRAARFVGSSWTGVKMSERCQEAGRQRSLASA